MKRFKNILYVFQSYEDQSQAIARAVSLAENNQAALTVLDVLPSDSVDIGLPPGGPVSAELGAVLKSGRRKAMEALVEPHRKRLEIRLESAEGIQFLEVIRAVLRGGHDLVIKPAEDPEWLERLFGSEDMHLLRKCPCPVWLMKPGEKSNYQCIVAAVDFDPADPDTVDRGINREIVELAVSLALSDFASLHLVHAWDAPAVNLLRMWSDDPEAAVAGYLETERTRHRIGIESLSRKLRQEIGDETCDYLSPRFHLINGAARKVIPQVAAEVQADLMIMGTVARTGIPGLIIGNTAESILDQLRCSVLAVKPPGFVSPVTLD